GVDPGHARGAVVLPVELLVGDDALGYAGGTVTPIEGQIGARGGQPVTEQRIRPAQRTGECARIGIDQQLVGVVAMATLRLVGTVRAQPIELPHSDTGDVTVPDFI